MSNTDILNQLCRDRESSMRRILAAEDHGEFDAALDRLAGEGLAGDGAGQPLHSPDEPMIYRPEIKTEKVRGIRI